MKSGSFDHHRVEPGAKVHLDRLTTDDKGGWGGKDDPAVARQLAEDSARLSELQERLFAEGRRSLLVVFQARDTAGKDGVLGHVVGPLDSRGVDVKSFGVPSREELAHDFLWRVHARAPERGHMTFFNRSHYEDVLAVRVDSLVPEETWSKRYRHINEFERMLADSGTTVIKFFLHISRKEQKRRLADRLADPRKRWKWNPGDLAARARWAEYDAAYQDAIERCSTSWAPWYVIPADHKWYRDLAVSRILVEALEAMDPRFPEATFDPAAITIPD